MKTSAAQYTRRVAFGGLTAALYVVLTLLSQAFGLASGAVQVRLSEALCILPVFTPYAIPGLFTGCIISNLITGCELLDVLFGSLATLIGAVGTYALRKNRILFCIPPVAANAVAVPLIITYVYMDTSMAYPLILLTVTAGEMISCVLMGQLLYSALHGKLEKVL
ncbi:MAG: transporter [Clostridiales bacterium]|nr:transporter [Clostridiales bacterium]